MTELQYKNAILRSAEISRKLSEILDDEGLTLFEEYCENYRSIVIYENKGNIETK